MTATTRRRMMLEVRTTPGIQPLQYLSNRYCEGKSDEKTFQALWDSVQKTNPRIRARLVEEPRRRT